MVYQASQGFAIYLKQRKPKNTTKKAQDLELSIWMYTYLIFSKAIWDRTREGGDTVGHNVLPLPLLFKCHMTVMMCKQTGLVRLSRQHCCWCYGCPSAARASTQCPGPEPEHHGRDPSSVPGGKVLVGWWDLGLKHVGMQGHAEASPLAGGLGAPGQPQRPAGPGQRAEGGNLPAVLLQGWSTPTELSMWTLC